MLIAHFQLHRAKNRFVHFSGMQNEARALDLANGILTTRDKAHGTHSCCYFAILFFHIDSLKARANT